MRLHALSNILTDVQTAITVALSIRDSNGALWIIDIGGNYPEYVVCQEAIMGEWPRPLVEAVIGVTVEADRFTDPVWFVKLGPGIWPIGRKL